MLTVATASEFDKKVYNQCQNQHYQYNTGIKAGFKYTADDLTTAE